MPSRAELVARGNATNVNPATYPNDSKFEQAILYAEKSLANSTTATTNATSAAVAAQISGWQNI